MKLLADLHTHSNFSRWHHGKNTIEELVRTANSKGLAEIAITDHGFKHLFRTNKDNLKKAREIVDEINGWSKTKVLLGIEADIIDEDGTLDIDNETLEYLDVLLVGYHRMIKTNFAGFFGSQPNTEEAKQKATNAFLNAIDRYPITILTHLNSVLNLDLYQIGCACRDAGVMVEFNARHPNWTDRQIKDLMASGCMFVASSDAHKREDVGEVSNVFEIFRDYRIPNLYVSNVEYSHAEKSEDDLEIDYYYGIYQQKMQEKQDKQEAEGQKRETEFTETLSEEMENELEKIAKEQGLAYKRRPTKDDLEKNDDEDLDNNDGSDAEAETGIASDDARAEAKVSEAGADVAGDYAVARSKAVDIENIKVESEILGARNDNAEVQAVAYAGDDAVPESLKNDRNMTNGGANIGEIAENNAAFQDVSSGGTEAQKTKASGDLKLEKRKPNSKFAPLAILDVDDDSDKK